MDVIRERLAETRESTAALNLNRLYHLDFLLRPPLQYFMLVAKYDNPPPPLDDVCP